MKVPPLLITAVLCSMVGYGQQDPIISTYQFNQLPVNPAYHGMTDATSFDLHYRSQWNDVEGAPTTIFLSGSSSLFDNKVGLGLTLLHDKLGVTTYSNFNLGGSYAIDLNSTTKLSFGLQASLMSLNYDFNDLNIDDPTDEDFVTADGLSKVNFGSGLFLSAPNYYLGLSIPQLLNVSEAIDDSSADRYNRHFYLSGGYVLDHFQSIKIKPYALLRMTEGAPVSSDLGVSALFADIIWGGLFTRNFGSIGLSAFLTLENNLRIGYLGELVTGDSHPSSGFNTHEITIGIDLELFDKQVAVRRYY